MEVCTETKDTVKQISYFCNCIGRLLINCNSIVITVTFQVFVFRVGDVTTCVLTIISKFNDS